jgi:hypothetical protein
VNAIKAMNHEEIISGLKETLFYLAICCYSEDKEEQEKVERMATSIHHAIEKLKGNYDA